MILPKRNPHMYGKQSLIRSSANILFIKVASGVIKSDDTLLNVEKEERKNV